MTSAPSPRSLLERAMGIVGLLAAAGVVSVAWWWLFGALADQSLIPMLLLHPTMLFVIVLPLAWGAGKAERYVTLGLIAADALIMGRIGYELVYTDWFVF